MAHAASSSISHQSQPPLNLLSGFFPESLNGMPQTSNRPSDHKLNCTQGSSNLHNTASNNQNIFETPLKPNIAPTPTNAAYDPNLSEMTKTISQSEEAGAVNRLSGTNFKPEHQTHRNDPIRPDSDSGSVGDDELKSATKISINEKKLPTTDKMNEVNNVNNTPVAGHIGMNSAYYTDTTMPVPNQQMYTAQISNGSCSMPLPYAPRFPNTMNALRYCGYPQFSNQYYNYNWQWLQAQSGQRKGGRQTYHAYQKAILEAEFKISRYITRKRRSELAEMIGLHEKQIKIWFQNRRMKYKKMNQGKREDATSTTSNAGESTGIAGSTGNTSEISECSSSTTARIGNESRDINLQHQLQQHPLSAELVSDAHPESQSAYLHAPPNAEYQADSSKIYNYNQIQDGVHTQTQSSPQTRINDVPSVFSDKIAQQYSYPSSIASSMSSGQGPKNPGSLAVSAAAAVHPIYGNEAYYAQKAALMFQQQQQIYAQSNDYYINYPSPQQQLQQQPLLHHQQYHQRFDINHM